MPKIDTLDALDVEITSIQSVPALRAARTDQPAVAEMPTHSFVQPATRLKP